MAGLFDLLMAKNPEEAKGVLSQVVTPINERFAALLRDPAGFMNSAVREGLGADQQDKAWAWRNGGLDAVTGSPDTRRSVEEGAMQASLNNAMLAGMLRGSGSEYLTKEQLLGVNKGRGLLSKADRKSLFDPNSGTNMSQQLGEMGNLNKEIYDVRNLRSQSKSFNDPLELQKHQRGLLEDHGAIGDVLDTYKNTPADISQSYGTGFRSAEFTKNAARGADNSAALTDSISNVFSAPSSGSWHANISKKIRDELNFLNIVGARNPAYSDGIEKLGQSATLEAIGREAKKRGLNVDYVSAKSSHAGGSQYIKTPDGRVVRVSDHELPETPQRLFNRSQGLTGKWDDEIILNDWRTSSIDDYINRILGKE